MLKYNYFKEFENLILTWNHVSNKINVLAATLHGSRPGVQSASLIMTSLITS